MGGSGSRDADTQTHNRRDRGDLRFEIMMAAFGWRETGGGR